MTDAETFKIK